MNRKIEKFVKYQLLLFVKYVIFVEPPLSIYHDHLNCSSFIKSLRCMITFRRGSPKFWREPIHQLFFFVFIFEDFTPVHQQSPQQVES